MSKKNRITIWVALLIVLLCATTAIFVMTLVTTNPTKIGPAGVTFWFINLLLMLASVVTLLLFTWRMRKAKNRENKSSILQSSFRTGFLLAFCATLLLALSSLRSLSWRDIILFLLTIVLIEIYFRTKRAEQ